MEKKLLTLLLSCFLLGNVYGYGENVNKNISTANININHSYDGAIITSGTVGGNIEWTLYDSGLLKLTGTGTMPNYGYTDISNSEKVYAPWYSYSYKERIRKVEVMEGITSIGKDAFAYLDNLQSVSLPSSLTTIESYAFYSTKSLSEINIYDNTTIYSYAFNNCPNIHKDNFPSNTNVVPYDDNNSIFELASDYWITGEDGSIIASTIA